MRNINWNEWKVRASQASKIVAGIIGVTDVQDAKIWELSERKRLAETGEAKPLTALMEKELELLLHKKANPELPQGFKTEVRKIYRAEKFDRNFLVSTKYMTKGIQMEDEAITVYQDYRKQILGINTYFEKNGHRLTNEWFSGEPDLSLGNDVKDCEEGFDIKCSWSLDSFPFAGDSLDDVYEWQNQVYMALTGAKKWTTAYVLTNISENLLQNEKMKQFYALESPEIDDKNYSEYIHRCKQLERQLIFDYDAFTQKYPHHLLEIGRKEWMENDWDIPLKNRVVEKVSLRSQTKIDFLKERVELARGYLLELDKL